MSNVNDQAPSFELKNTKKEPVSLDSYKGKTVVLAFYPGAFTGVCDTEMCTFNDNLSKLNDSNAVVLGISVDSPWQMEHLKKNTVLNLSFCQTTTEMLLPLTMRLSQA